MDAIKPVELLRCRESGVAFPVIARTEALMFECEAAE